MLAADRAANFEAQLQDVCAETLRPLQLTRFAGVEEDQRMQVAVGCVKHVRARQLILLGQLADACEYAGDALARNGAVHAVVIRRNAPHRGECRLAALPQAEAFLLVVRHATMLVAPHASSTRCMCSISSATSSLVPSDSHNSTAAASSGYPACANSSTAATAARSSISRPAGMIPAAMIAATACAACSHSANPGHDHARAFRAAAATSP